MATKTIRSSVIGVRVHSVERRLIESSARQRQITVGELLRFLGLEQARRDLGSDSRRWLEVIDSPSK